MILENGISLLRLKRLENLEMCSLRLRLAKSGRNVTRQEQRMARAGSTWDLWRLQSQYPFFDPKSRAILQVEDV